MDSRLPDIIDISMIDLLVDIHLFESFPSGKCASIRETFTWRHEELCGFYC